MSDCRASLVIPSYAGARRLPVLFDALRTQGYTGEWEAVVVLDGVVDDSEAVIADCAGDLPVRVVRLEANRGRPAALNAGFATARGDVLIRCDDDLEPGPDYIADHVAAHAGPDEVGAVGLYRNVFDDSAYARVYARDWDERFRAGAYSGDLGPTWQFWAGNCSVSRDLFDRVGPYDEDFREYGWEDIDWGYRLAATGATIVLDPRLETRHHAANTTVAIRLRRAYASGRARARFDRKHLFVRDAVPTTGVVPRLWAAASGLLVRFGSPERFSTWGTWADRSLDRLPSSVGTRAVAMLVESSAKAGQRDAVRHGAATSGYAGADDLS